MVDFTDVTWDLRRGTREYCGGVEMLCPEGCGTLLTTSEAQYQEQIPGGLRFVSVPCVKCNATFTIEIFEKDRYNA